MSSDSYMELPGGGGGGGGRGRHRRRHTSSAGGPAAWTARRSCTRQARPWAAPPLRPSPSPSPSPTCQCWGPPGTGTAPCPPARWSWGARWARPWGRGTPARPGRAQRWPRAPGAGAAAARLPQAAHQHRRRQALLRVHGRDALRLAAADFQRASEHCAHLAAEGAALELVELQRLGRALELGHLRTGRGASCATRRPTLALHWLLTQVCRGRAARAQQRQRPRPLLPPPGGPSGERLRAEAPLSPRRRQGQAAGAGAQRATPAPAPAPAPLQPSVPGPARTLELSSTLRPEALTTP
jgi:hypothetical protein